MYRSIPVRAAGMAVLALAAGLGSSIALAQASPTPASAQLPTGAEAQPAAAPATGADAHPAAASAAAGPQAQPVPASAAAGPQAQPVAASASGDAQAQPVAAPLPISAAPAAQDAAAAEAPASSAGTSAAAIAAQLRRADSVALSLPDQHWTVETLAHALTDGLTTDREKIRAIYRWVTTNVAYDARGITRRLLQDPGTVLRRREAVCDGFALLVGNLALKSGLKAEFVDGHAKGLGVENGEGGEGHSWDAVQVDGQWALVDAAWGSGDVVDGRFVRGFREFFFMTPPEKLIWTHLPSETRWQLLPRPLTGDEFRRQPLLQRDFFELGFEPAAMLDAAAAPGFNGFAGVFPVKGRAIQVVDAPVARDLSPAAEYTVSLDAPGADSVTIVTAGRWVPLARQGARFTTRFTPGIGAGTVVMVAYPGDAQPRVILSYAPIAAPGTRRSR